MAGKRRLRDIFTEAGKRQMKAVFLAGAMLAGCSSTPKTENAPTLPPDAAYVTASVANAQTYNGRRITPETEAIFKRNAPAPVNDNLSEEKRINAYINQLCFSLNTPQREEQEYMRSALTRLAALPLTGRPLVEMAARDNVQFCNITHLPAGTGAQYVPGLGAVLAPSTRSANVMVLHIAHEILHAAQDKNDLLSYQYSWDIHSRLSRNLSIEAAAMTYELMVALEAKHAGDTTMWDFMRGRVSTQSSYGDPRLYTIAEETWQKSKEAGMADKNAMREVGKALWTHMFENQSWLNFYLNFELATYVRDVTSGMLDNMPIQENGYSQRRIDNAGKIASDLSFTEGGKIPPLEKLLAGNDRMRQAFAAVDVERHRRSLGENHPQTRALRKAALEDNNPYLNLDFAALLKKMRENAFPDAEGRKKFAYLHDYMDVAIGRDTPRLAEKSPEATPPQPPEAQGKPGVAPAAAPVDMGVIKSQGMPDASPEPAAEKPEPVPPRDTLARSGLRGFGHGARGA